MAMVNIQNDQQFEQNILQKDGICIVDFYADWCMPCKMQVPILEAFAQENDDIVIAKVNIDELREIAQRYHIQTIPSILVFKDGALVHQVSGVQSKDALDEMIQNANA